MVDCRYYKASLTSTVPLDQKTLIVDGSGHVIQTESTTKTASVHVQLGVTANEEEFRIGPGFAYHRGRQNTMPSAACQART
jgi:hypothetical protein